MFSEECVRRVEDDTIQADYVGFFTMMTGRAGLFDVLALGLREGAVPFRSAELISSRYSCQAARLARSVPRSRSGIVSSAPSRLRAALFKTDRAPTRFPVE